MDLTFDIKDTEGNHLIVALSSYDTNNIRALTSDSRVLALEFYDVSLFRKSGDSYVGIKILYEVINILAKFLKENKNAVLSFYCDPVADIKRSHIEIPPQQYRSLLFTRMFDVYIKRHKEDFINHVIEIEDNTSVQYAHFICRKEHLNLLTIIHTAIVEDK